MSSGKPCGRCRGRGSHRPIGLGPDVTCEDCNGTGEKQPPKRKERYEIEYEKPAAICRFEGRVPGRACGGRKTWHHIVARARIVTWLTQGQWVTKELAQKITAVLEDPRNLIEACKDCHLGLIETGNPAAQVRESDLPDGFWLFVEKHNLWSQLPRHLMGLAPDKAPEAA